MISFANLLRSNKHSWLDGYDFNSQFFTPDAFRLDNMVWHRLFVYNNLQPDQAGNTLLDKDMSIQCAAAFTTNSNYVMWKKKLGAETFPFSLETTQDMTFGRETYFGPAGKILGKLYLVRPAILKKLDELYLNSVQFDRRRISLDIPYREKEGPWIGDKQIMRLKAWSYVGNSEFWIGQHEINEHYCGKVKHFAHTSTILNSEKESIIYYYYDDKFEINP